MTKKTVKVSEICYLSNAALLTPLEEIVKFLEKFLSNCEKIVMLKKLVLLRMVFAYYMFSDNYKLFGIR